MANGLLSDWMSGTGVYGNPNAVDPQTGVPYADTRAAQLGALGNIGSLLIAAGQPMTGPQRAQLLGQIGPQISGMQTDIYNAAQRRLMQAQFAEKQAELADTAKIRDLMKDPNAFKAATGYDLGQFTGLSPSEVGAAIKQISVAKLSRDPTEAALKQAQLLQAQREVAQPKTITAGNKVLQLNEQTGKWDVIAEGEPSGGLEGRNQALIISGMKNPDLANSPEYAIAYNQLYGPKFTTVYNPETKMMEYQWVRPDVPAGVVAPKFGVTQQSSAQPSAVAPSVTAPSAQPSAAMPAGEAVVAPQMPARSGVKPLIAQPPKEQQAPSGYVYTRAPGTNGPDDAGEMVATTGGPGTQISADIQGKLALTKQFLEDYSPSIEKAIKEGRFANNNYADRARYKAEFGDMGELNRFFQIGADGIIRTVTGMGMNIKEQDKYIDLYVPKWTDSEFTIKSKFKSMKGILSKMKALAEQGRVGPEQLESTRKLLEEYKPETEPKTNESPQSATGTEQLSEDDLINKYSKKNK
jgi:hypothetical protein